MNDLIDRRTLIKDLVADCLKAKEETKQLNIKELYKRIEELIDKQKQIEAKPVVKGEWLYERETYNTCSAWKCSNCGECYGLPFVKDEYNFCPECGADMRGGKNE